VLNIILVLTLPKNIVSNISHSRHNSARYYYTHGNECGKNESNENFKTTIPSNNYDRPKTTGECEMF
jgi:hypothetical protein